MAFTLPDTLPHVLKATETENQLKALAQKVYAHRLFDRFVEGSWSPTIERNLRKQVCPSPFAPSLTSGGQP